MNNLGGASTLAVGILVVLLGLFVQSGIVETLVDIIGLLIVAVGVIIGIFGLLKMFSGGSSSGSDY